MRRLAHEGCLKLLTFVAGDRSLQDREIRVLYFWREVVVRSTYSMRGRPVTFDPLGLETREPHHPGVRSLTKKGVI